MGPYRATALAALILASASLQAWGQQPGWHYSGLPGEGDRASMGCATDSSTLQFTCLVVRCEDDFTAGLHVHSSRRESDAGLWEFTLDRETRHLTAYSDEAPYGARISDPEDWLLDGLRHGTFVYLRHADDIDQAFAYISLAGSFRSIAEALQWCAPRLPAGEQIVVPNVGPETIDGEIQ